MQWPVQFPTTSRAGVRISQSAISAPYTGWISADWLAEMKCADACFGLAVDLRGSLSVFSTVASYWYAVFGVLNYVASPDLL
jgi:hypothetical protein